jgi:hypothetical protein
LQDIALAGVGIPNELNGVAAVEGKIEINRRLDGAKGGNARQQPQAKKGEFFHSFSFPNQP